MSGRGSFTVGMILGALVGGVVGAVVGAMLVDSSQEIDPAPSSLPQSEALDAGELPEVDAVRRSLEEKISQLNQAIDEVRQQLGTQGPQA